jgi:hypothetical protein
MFCNGLEHKENTHPFSPSKDKSNSGLIIFFSKTPSVLLPQIAVACRKSDKDIRLAEDLSAFSSN